MSYGYNYGNDYRRGPRINEDDVPESKHTIFVRGLPGSMSTDEIKDYFEDKIGPVSFDFVKTSPDNQRLFVAVRFETREDAKSAMTEYSKRDLLGYRCDLTWFKDVRRFAEYQRAQGITPGRGRGGYRGRGGFGRGGYRNDRRHSRDRSRGCSGSSRSRSRSRSRGTRSESGTPRSRRRSRSNTRSKSRSLSRDRRRSSSRGSNDSRDNDYRRKDRKRRRSHHSRSNVSSDREAEHEKKADRSPSPVPPVVNPPPPQIKVTIKTTKEDMIPMPPTPSQLTSNGGMPVESPAKAYLPTAAPPPAEVPLPTPVPAPTTIGPSVNQLNTSFTIKMDTAETKIIQKTENTETVLIGSRQSQETREEQEKRIVTVNLPPTPTSVSHYMKQQEVQANTPRGSFRPVGEIQVEEQPPVKIPRHEEPLHPSQYHMNANPYNSWTPVNKYESPMSQKDSAFGYNGGTPKPSYDLSKYPLHSKLFSDLRDFQEQQIASVKAVPQEETLGSLALSTLSTNNDDVEADKRCIREQVLASMKEIELERFTIHKRKLENAFKGDCTTYAIVTKRLLSKDPSLEKQLRMCLIESMEDLEKQMFDKIDAHLGI